MGDNEKKIKQNKTLPYLVSNIIEVLDVNPEDEEEIEGANVDLDSQRKGKSVVIKTTTRQTYFLPVAGLVEPEKLKPGDLVGVNKDSYLILTPSHVSMIAELRPWKLTQGRLNSTVTSEVLTNKSRNSLRLSFFP